MNWKKGPVIGRGSSAIVSLATTAAGDLFAVKSAELSTSLCLQKEQQILSKLQSPHIINYIGFDVNCINNIPMYNLFMEYASFGTISDIIKKQSGSLDECLIRSYTHQILLGLDYLHNNNLVHCDIKCQNLMVTKDGIKIGDLGCAKSTKDGEFNSSAFSGTPVFMAPEVARGEEQGFTADVWALGSAVIEMATGCNPWPEVKDPVSALYRIGYSGDMPLIPASLSMEAKDFLKNCFQIKASERWTVKELLQHPFVNFDCNSIKFETFPKNSPSSILDQGIWDSSEVADASPDQTLFTNFSGESPVERIRQLVDASSLLPNWVDEEDWISVRSNQSDKSLNVLQENLYTDVHVEDAYNESTRTDSESFSEFDIEEGFLISDRMMLESDVIEINDVNVVSRFLDCKNVNDDDNCLLVDSNPFVTLLDSVFIFFPLNRVNKYQMSSHFNLKI